MRDGARECSCLTRRGASVKALPQRRIYAFFNLLPLINLTNYNPLGTRNFRPQYQNPHHWQFLNTTTLAAGAHSVRAGVEVRLKNNELVDVVRRTPAYNFTGQITGDAIGDLLLGLPRQLSATTRPIVDWRQRPSSSPMSATRGGTS